MSAVIYAVAVITLAGSTLAILGMLTGFIL